MGFLKNLFGNGKKRTLEDEKLGTFSVLSSQGNMIIWKGGVNFLDEDISLFISGDKNNIQNGKITSSAFLSPP